MSRLAVIGAGGHGRVVADAALAGGDWTEIVFYDHAWPERSSNGPWAICGDVATLLGKCGDYAGIVVAVGNNERRLDLCRQVRKNGGILVPVIHPRATVSPYAAIGHGTVVFAGAVVNVGARIGDAAIINTAATVDHDCVLEDGVHLSPGAHLSGDVHVGARAWLGVGSCVRNQIRIGAGAMVGAGAVVVRDVSAGVTVAGNPATPLRARLEPNFKQ